MLVNSLSETTRQGTVLYRTATNLTTQVKPSSILQLRSLSEKIKEVQTCPDDRMSRRRVGRPRCASLLIPSTGTVINFEYLLRYIICNPDGINEVLQLNFI